MKRAAAVPALIAVMIISTSCDGGEKAIVKTDTCLKVYISPKSNSRTVDCIDNFTEVDVLSTERANVILEGKKGDFVAIAYIDEEGDRKVGFAFDANMYYPRPETGTIVMIALAALLIALIITAGLTLAVRFIARQCGAGGGGNGNGIIILPAGVEAPGRRISRPVIVLFASLAALVILTAVIFIVQMKPFRNIPITRTIDAKDLRIKRKVLGTYAKKYERAMDYTSPVTRDYALNLAARYPGKFSIQQVCDVYDNVRKKWKYVNDPLGIEYVSRASESIENGLIGDCDDFAVLSASLLMAVGGRTRIVYAEGKKGIHAYAEVKIPVDTVTLDYINTRYRSKLERFLGLNRIDTIHSHKGMGLERWLNLDWSAMHPGGKYFDSNYLIIIYPSGYYVEKRNLSE